MAYRAAAMGQGVAIGDLSVLHEEITKGELVLPFKDMQISDDTEAYYLCCRRNCWTDPASPRFISGFRTRPRDPIRHTACHMQTRLAPSYCLRSTRSEPSLTHGPGNCRIRTVSSAKVAQVVDGCRRRNGRLEWGQERVNQRKLRNARNGAASGLAASKLRNSNSCHSDRRTFRRRWWRVSAILA